MKYTFPAMAKELVEIYTRDWKDYLAANIQPGESVLLEELRKTWSKARLLDLGIGLGRTTWFFAPLVEQYVGLDVVPRMIEECVRLFGESDRRRFAVADAKDLSQFGDGSFDVVVFSYNGIDHLGHDERALAFAEIRRVLSPGGVFFFSSHSLLPFPHYPTLTQFLGRNPIRWPVQLFRKRRELRGYKKANLIAQSPEVQKRGWAILPDQAHGWSLEFYYCRPKTQKQELERAGFQVEKILDGNGKPVPDLEKPGPSWWFYYLCRNPKDGTSS